ncbi:hypothetical protein [Kitasatospora sp. NPDC050543]|uniref:hypothetical protein n=1 Tax=Kitasatospora sp. NPDC050543 TaxID=3364054 RepID=UPI003795DC55
MGTGQAGGGWRAAWTGGRPAVHLGNVADFNAQFFDRAMDVPQRRRRLGQGHHYACMAACYSPEPAVVVLPHHLEDAWVRLLTHELEWGAVELHSGVAPEQPLVRALAGRPALLERITGSGLPVLPWGRTAALDTLLGAGVAPAGPDVLEATRRYESKAASHELFAAIAPGHDLIAVPRQERPDTLRRAARLLAARAARGGTTVLKTPHGVGGFGTVVVTPRELAAAGGARALLRRLAAEEVLTLGGGLLLEEYVDGGGRLRNPTFDAVIGPDGAVHPVGVGAMDVDGTHYQGVTVGPGVVPGTLARAADRFGREVGRALAAGGYRGWFDIDFVTDRAHRLAPTEINLRLTGPAVAFVIQARLDEVRGPGHLVRTIDGLPLGARLPQEALFEHLERLRLRCAPLGASLLPLIPTAGFEELPSVGLALAARSAETLDAAESLVRAGNHALGGLFETLVDADGASEPRSRMAW